MSTILAEEEAATRLAMIVSPVFMPSALEEVARRAIVFEYQWRQLPNGHDTTPRLAAYDSVYHDALLGRIW